MFKFLCTDPSVDNFCEQGFLELKVGSILCDVYKHTFGSTSPPLPARKKHWRGIVLVRLLSYKQLSPHCLVQAIGEIHFKQKKVPIAIKRTAEIVLRLIFPE